MRKFIFIFFTFFIPIGTSFAAECTAETPQDGCTCLGWYWQSTDFADEPGECTPCDNIPTGAIQDSTHATCNWTMTCPAGTYYDANTQECEQCEGDTFSTGTTVYQDSQPTKCTSCAAHSSANDNHTQCICDGGFFSDSNGTCSNTKSCSAGTYLAADGSCKTCEQGYYCPGGSQQNDGSGQTPCPKHFTSDSGATSASGCYMKTDTEFCDDSDCYRYSDIFNTRINYPG